MWLNNSFSVYTYISLYHIIDFLRRCSMYRFQGQVSLALLETLSNTLRDLHLSVADTEQYLALSHYLSAATSHLPLLENFSKWFHWVCLVTNVKTSTPMHHADFYLLMYYDNFFFIFFSTGMHIPACTVDTELLQPLPKGLTLQLIISKVDGDALTWACRAASALQPEGRRWACNSVLRMPITSRKAFLLVIGIPVYPGWY